MKKRIWVKCLAACLAVSMLAGCGGGGGSTEAIGNSTAAEGSQANGEKIFRWAATATSTGMNPHQSNSGEIVDYIQATLYRYWPSEDGKSAYLGADLAAGEPVPGADELTWQIPIDPNAQWSNGDPINADTFLYSWKMALDPNLVYESCSVLAEDFISIENAQAYYGQLSSGTEVAWEDVGIKKVDEHTLEIRTTRPYSAQAVMRHFTNRVTGPVYETFYESGMNEDRTSTTYGTELTADMVFSGPFVLTDWVKGSRRNFSKNENYLHADQVKLDGMQVSVIKDTGTQMEMFERGELDYIVLDINGVEKYGEDPRVIFYTNPSIRGIEMNMGNPNQPILANLNFRKALYYAMDREQMAEMAHQKAADYFIPYGAVSYADGTNYRDLDIAKANIPENSYDPELAKEYFNKALEETGLAKVTLQLNYSDSISDTKMLSEYMQKSLSELFGPDRFELTLQAMPSKQMYDTMRNYRSDPASYELSWCAADVTAEVFDPNKKFGLYVTGDSRSYAPYNDTALDQMYAESLEDVVRLDETKSAEYTAKMEKEVMDQTLTVPIYQVQQAVLYSDRMILPVETYISGLSWGWAFADIAE